MNQEIDFVSAAVLTLLCTLAYLGAAAWRRRRDSKKEARPGSITYWQDGEQHTVDAGPAKTRGKKPRSKRHS